MIEVIVEDKMPNDVMDLVKELRSLGYVQGVDFDFEYHPPKYNDWAMDAEYNRKTVFRFYKDELSTWFELRYK